MSRRLGAALILATIVAGAVAVPALAHALLVGSDPANGAELSSAPRIVVMTFSEDPDPSLSVVHVLDANGKAVEAGPVRAVPGKPLELQIPLPSSLPDGTYTVTWRTVSKQDGHVTASAFAFGVGVKPAQASAASGGGTVSSPTPSVANVAGKLLLYVGLVLLFAAGAMALAAFGGHVPARRGVLAGGWLAAALGAVTTLITERAAVGVGFGELLRSEAGHAYIWLLAAVAVAGIAALLAALRPATWSLALVVAAASAAMLVRAEGGHASASRVVPMVEVGLQWFHIMAASAWIGGIALASLLLQERRRGARPTVEIRRFSRIAGYALGVVVLTGVLRAIDERGGLSAIGRIFAGSYGLTLLLKVLVVLVLIGLGAYNRYRSIPRMEEDPRVLRRLMGVELIAALGVFGLTGVLTGLPPVTTAAAQRPAAPTNVSATGSDFATTVRVRLTVTPGTPGPNDFDASVTDFDSGKPLAATGVTLTFQPVGAADVGESSLAMRRKTTGEWIAHGTNLSLAGVWNVTAVVQTGSTSASVPLTLTTRVPPSTTTVNRAPGQPDLYTIAFPGGQQLQAYNDPGAPGTNELHVTAFDAAGNELPLASIRITARPPSGAAIALRTRRFSAGHFVGDETLTPGRWTFLLQATARSGAVLVASFEQTIGATGGS